MVHGLGILFITLALAVSAHATDCGDGDRRGALEQLDCFCSANGTSRVDVALAELYARAEWQGLIPTRVTCDNALALAMALSRIDIHDARVMAERRLDRLRIPRRVQATFWSNALNDAFTLRRLIQMERQSLRQRDASPDGPGFDVWVSQVAANRFDADEWALIHLLSPRLAAEAWSRSERVTFLEVFAEMARAEALTRNHSPVALRNCVRVTIEERAAAVREVSVRHIANSCLTGAVQSRYAAEP